ncbi:HAD-IIIC family phosphatase [Loktanella sp. Alg231-35]|uniref:HAD-IIIC family phosphatase n=1 Tax=Loktanella sp. Alg231-35 TaxID=1922220 RepID=UPI00131ED73D|nr:HAD-IIIC family phosphatase [Loktanella sp. Alg231-35]
MFGESSISINDRKVAIDHLRQNSDVLARALNPTAHLVPRIAPQLGSDENEQTLAQNEHLSLIEYLARWIETEDVTFRALYLGERAKMAYDPQQTGQERNAFIRTLIVSDAQCLENAISDVTCQRIVADCFADLANRTSAEDVKELNVLLIGDCLYLDIVGFLIDSTAQTAVSIRPTFVTDKNPAGVIAELRRLAKEPFDAIFYSPFTYENGLTVPQKLMPRKLLRHGLGFGVDEIVNDMMDEARQVIQMLAKAFAAPTFVHNTALIQRHVGRQKDALLRSLTAQTRKKIRAKVDAEIDSMLAALNADTFTHLFKVDELALLQDHSEHDLAQYLHHHGLQHPARLGAALASVYTDILETIAHLSKKKLVVCDLDNTLWDGVIGEGSVTHHADRQGILKKLKSKGVILAIASKNDPANVVWDGGVLDESDFVSSQISWQPKVTAFPAISSELNLKRKDFVFVDDRPDERGLVTQAYPEIHAVDAEDARTWDLFALWERLLGDGSDMDRTQMYLDRAKRQEFEAETNADDAVSKRDLFSQLGLEVTIEEAAPKELNRAAELINRTNQFNMTAARTTFKEVTQWSESPDHRVYVARSRDKFGDMGVVSVLIADLSGETMQIPAFVLSCRVFGYDIEVALLNHLKREATTHGLVGISGQHVPTMVNAPCRDTYSNNSFVEDQGGWVWTAGSENPVDPEWLKIT